MDGLPARAAAALDRYLALGNVVEETAGARFVRNPDAPAIHDANHVSGVTVTTPPEIDAVLAHAEEVFTGLEHRHAFCGPVTPPGSVDE